MKAKLLFLTLCVILGSYASAYAQEKKDDQPSLEELCEKEADRLQAELDLEDWQAFYVDSTLKHDHAAMRAEYDQLRASKVANASMYQAVQDKWMDRIDATYRRLFNDDQWNLYLKRGAAKAQAVREKRRLKAEASASQPNGKKK